MQRTKKSHKKSAFLLKTYDMLNNETFKNILDWNQDGIGFIIYDIDLFANDVLSVYFKHSNFPSFIRQLNMYGFSKKRTIKNESYYYHPKFQRNQKELIGEIQRRVQKKTSKQNPDERKEDCAKSQKIPSEISIQLESKQQMVKQQEIEFHEKKLCIDFYKLMNINQALLHEQISAILGILGDMKALTSQSFTPQQQDIKNTFLEYSKCQTNFHFNLLQKAKNDIKDSQKYIRTSILLETKETLQALGSDIGHE